jgi:hypothetical protein
MLFVTYHYVLSELWPLQSRRLFIQCILLSVIFTIIHAIYYMYHGAVNKKSLHDSDKEWQVINLWQITLCKVPSLIDGLTYTHQKHLNRFINICKIKDINWTFRYFNDLSRKWAMGNLRTTGNQTFLIITCIFLTLSFRLTVQQVISQTQILRCYLSRTITFCQSYDERGLNSQLKWW